MTEHYEIIEVKDIYPNPNQPRTEFNPQDIDELAESIKENGLIQPIIVKKSDIFGYELIAGERRLRAIKKLGKSKIPAIIKEVSNRESMQQSIVENLQRSNLNPIEEAVAYQRLVEEEGMTHDDIAKYMGKSRPYISNSLRLLNLPLQIRSELISNSISQGHARLLLSLETEEEQLQWLSRIKKEHLSVRALENSLKSLTSKSKKNQKTKNLFVSSVENELKKELGLDVTISYKNSKGHIQINFNSDKDFEEIIHKLKS